MDVKTNQNVICLMSNQSGEKAGNFHCIALGYGAIPQMWLVSVGTFHMMSDSHEFS